MAGLIEQNHMYDHFLFVRALHDEITHLSQCSSDNLRILSTYNTIASERKFHFAINICYYQEHFFNVRSEARTTDYGDITERLELRKRLKCKSFSWYLEHIYPEQNMPDEKGNGGAVPKGGFKKEDKPRAVKEGHVRIICFEVIR